MEEKHLTIKTDILKKQMDTSRNEQVRIEEVKEVGTSKGSEIGRENSGRQVSRSKRTRNHEKGQVWVK